MAEQTYRVAHQLTNGREVAMVVYKGSGNARWCAELWCSGWPLLGFHGSSPKVAVGEFKRFALDLLQDALIGTCGILAKIDATGFPAPQVGEVSDPGDEHNAEAAR